MNLGAVLSALRTHRWFIAVAAGLLSANNVAIAADGDLRDLDVIGWPCLNSPSGTAKTQDGIERNQKKNRPAVDLSTAKVEALDTAGFLKKVRDFDARFNAQRRSDLSPATKALLDQYEGQVVSLTGWLVLTYPGPPETTNCGDRNYHDWHLEVFEQSSDHHPQIGDPTPIICEITPRTEQAIFRDNIRLRALAGFFRGGKEYQPTGHAPKRIRLTGFLCWDDDHNGKADVGPTVDNITPANGYHHPWRSTAWEIHPVMKIEVLDSSGSSPAQPATATRQPQVTSTPAANGNARPQPSTAPAASPTNAPEFITIVRPVTVTIPYGETVLHRAKSCK